MAPQLRASDDERNVQKRADMNKWASVRNQSFRQSGAIGGKVFFGCWIVSAEQVKRLKIPSGVETIKPAKEMLEKCNFIQRVIYFGPAGM